MIRIPFVWHTATRARVHCNPPTIIHICFTNKDITKQAIKGTNILPTTKIKRAQKPAGLTPGSLPGPPLTQLQADHRPAREPAARKRAPRARARTVV